jgi:2-polyprenyl-3-methyl-5-hydroxy-6-metoxy-1,4-benzoquinol methylase
LAGFRPRPPGHGAVVEEVPGMAEEVVRELDAEARALFARKGWEAGPSAPQTGEANGVKVRRIMQLTRDLERKPFEALRILDLGCGEGVYAVEAGLRGARVVAIDARTLRMDLGAAVAARHGLDSVRFVRDDVRRVTREAYGEFDVVYALGVLYHLDAPDLFAVLENVHALCTGLLVIDTLTSGSGSSEVAWRDRVYRGQRDREHDDGDSPAVRRARVLRSIDNTFAFRLTRESWLRAVHDVGFTSVFECHVPFEPDKAPERVTLVGVKGSPVRLSTYPWVNGQSEAEIARRLRQAGQAPTDSSPSGSR